MNQLEPKTMLISSYTFEAFDPTSNSNIETHVYQNKINRDPWMSISK